METAAQASKTEVQAPTQTKQELLEQVLAGTQTLLFDGGFGTMLQARNLRASGNIADELCVSAPSEIAAIHRAYVEAGAQVATTNTFNTNARSLAAAHVSCTVEELYAAAAECARRAGALCIAGDIGPLGEFLEPYGDLEEEEAYELFARNARAAEACGCDLILIETMMDINEACVAVQAAREHTALPVFATMSFNEQGRTLFGVAPEQAAHELGEAGAHAIGMNCSVGPREALSVVKSMKQALEVAPICNAPSLDGSRVYNNTLRENEHTSSNAPSSKRTTIPLMVQPNAGLPDTSTGQAVYHCSPQEFAEAVVPLVQAGATIVGGCCGTTPAHIAAVAAALKIQ